MRGQDLELVATVLALPSAASIARLVVGGRLENME
jgi:hypothetical protein